MQRYYPSLKDIIYTTLSVINNHPNIKEPIVKNPLPDINGVFQPIPIVKYRNFEGLELPEGGLTLSIFPRHDRGNFSYGAGQAAVYEPYTLGPKTQGFLAEATYHIVVHLALRDVALGNFKNLVYLKDKFNNVTSSSKEELSSNTGEPEIFIKEESVPVEINAAEDILRDYLEIIRVILESIDYYAPWNLRSTTVSSLSFPTSSWDSDNKQLIFHQAYLNWDIATYAPVGVYDPTIIKHLDFHFDNC